MASSNIIHVHSQTEIDSLLNENSGVVVGFRAAWSAPCRGIATFYSRLAATHRTLIFVEVEVDADNIQSFAHIWRLTALPTFIMIEKEKEIGRIRGADRKGLEDMIAKHAPVARSPYKDAGCVDVIAAGDESLLGYLDMRQINCLNEAQHHPLKSIVEMGTRNTAEAYLESDADERLLITLTFNQEVELRSLVLYTKDPKLGPKNIKIDINKPTMGFDDVESAAEPAVIEVLGVPEEVVKEGRPIRLRFAQLQRVISLHLFVESNHGNGGVTRINAIDVYGKPAPTTQMSGLRDFWGPYWRGMELLGLFNYLGGLQNLSNAVALLRESALLCSTEREQHAALVGNLALALLSRYRHQGDYADLDEAITIFYGMLELYPPGHPERSSCLDNLSIALWIRYERDGKLADLEEAITQSREGLSLLSPDHPSRATFLNNLSNALLARYEREGRLSDLEDAIAQQREALHLHPPGHPYHAASLNNLSAGLLIRCTREGGLPDLVEAIELLREALNLHPRSHPDYTLSLGNLSNALLDRYDREGSPSDLEEAIEMQREALNLRPPGHPERAKCLDNLSTLLRVQCEHEGSLSAVKEAIELQREALNLHPPGHPDRACSLDTFSTVLLTLYDHEGRLSDLGKAIGMQRGALGLRPPGHPDRVLSLGNLANALLTRYERKGSLSDLEEAIDKQREALDLCPPRHRDHAIYLNNLANTLLNRYQRDGSLSDLNEAIKMQREALNLHPQGHPDRALSLGNLASALLDRYERGGSPSDSEEAIGKAREALDLRPSGHPERGGSLNNLSGALLARYGREGKPSDLEEAIEQQREALDLCPLDHPDRSGFLSNFSDTLLTRYLRDRGLLDLTEATEQCETVLKLRPRGHPGRSNALSSLSRAYLLAIKRKNGAFTVCDHRSLVDHVFTMLREAVNHSNSPPVHRLEAALLWIDASLQLAPRSLLDAFNAALDQLDIVLATSSTLASKHSQLSSEKLIRCKQLGVEAASCAVRQGEINLAIEFLERGRNLLFAQVGRYRIELEDLRKENAELAKQFSDLSSLLDASMVSNQPIRLEGRTMFEDAIGRYRRVASEWDQVVNDIRAVPGFENFLRPPHYSLLQAAAAEGPVVVTIPDDDKSHALIILQGRDTPHYVNLPKASKEELVMLYDDFLKAVNSDDEEDADSRMTALLRKLWVRVVGPIADALDKELSCPLYSRIWWCPSSYLSFLPLHAAGHYTSNADPNQNFPAKYVSSYTPTLGALLRARSKPSTGKGENMLIVAQPDTPSQCPLVCALPEARIVKTLAEAKMKMKTTSLISKEGTHAAVLHRIIDHSWIHLICHGSQNPVNPFDSCFHLYDKQLTLRDIMQCGLPDAKFAFLVACHTATGDIKLLDEGLHLAAGLQFAGFKSVVGTIWEVADIDGPVIAEAFYKALQVERVGEEGIDAKRAAPALGKAVKYLWDNGTPISRWIRYVHIGI